MRSLRLASVMSPPLLLAAGGLVHPHYLMSGSASLWQAVHVALLPIFPLSALGFVVPLWGRPKADLVGLVTVLGWVGSFVYATFYTALDLIAGVAAGAVAQNTPVSSDLGAATYPLFQLGDQFGRIGIYGFAVAALAMSAVLCVRRGPSGILSVVILLTADCSFRTSHIFWPRGVVTMVVISCGFGLAAWQTRPRKSMPNS